MTPPTKHSRLILDKDVTGWGGASNQTIFPVSGESPPGFSPPESETSLRDYTSPLANILHTSE